MSHANAGKRSPEQSKLKNGSKVSIAVSKKSNFQLQLSTLFKEYLIIQNKKDWSANSIC